MSLNKEFPLVDEILEAFRVKIGPDFGAYKNHVYRVVHLSLVQGSFNAVEQEKIQVAACFHDIGIWTADTFDYLDPSEEAAAAYLVSRGNADWLPDVSAMVVWHHKLSACEGSGSRLAEVFRRADFVDVSLGVLGMGIPRADVSAIRSAFPNRGFHAMLVKRSLGWTLRHPLRPAPMFRR